GGGAGFHPGAPAPAPRRGGHARAVTTALVQALRHSGCGSIELRATETGAPLYRTLGFDPVDGYMALRPGAEGWTR
ncbi:GNAT family N-acetyltransferase, partial [Kitasatospora sp. NPDC059817]